LFLSRAVLGVWMVFCCPVSEGSRQIFFGTGRCCCVRSRFMVVCLSWPTVLWSGPQCDGVKSVLHQVCEANEVRIFFEDMVCLERCMEEEGVLKAVTLFYR
ncbi:unnamed protein product, partial [Ectocarpus sp. 12 AP-2014]